MKAYEPYYGIECLNEPKHMTCTICGNELHDCFTKQFINDIGRVEGCDGCIDTYKNKVNLQCQCEKFNSDTDYIYTKHGTQDVFGCSECVDCREEDYYE